MATKILSYGFLFLAIIFNGYGQSTNSPNEAGMARRLKAQATEMGTAFIRGDYKTFSRYTYAKITAIMGGPDQMTAELTKVINEMKRKGMAFNNISFGEVSKMTKSGNELQCTLPEYIEIKMPNGRMVSTSTLIAISTNKGIDWTFVDTSNKEMATIRKLLPNLSRAILVPPQQAPVQYNN